MKSTVTHESATRVRFQIEATKDEMAPAVDRAFRKLANEVKVPGFRKGKVPRKVLEARLGADEIRDATVQEAVPELFRKALTENDVHPLTLPEIEVTSYEPGEGLAFDAVVEVRPEITIPDVAGISVERPRDEATASDVDEQLERLRDRFATLQTVTRPGRKGDFALIDLKGYIHDTEVSEASATDLLYEVGSERLVPELDRELDAKRQGDILKFNANLPETFPGEHAGKEISFQVLVKEIREKVLPAIDDEFAKTASEFDTLDELRGDLQTRIAEVKRVSADAEVRNRVLERLVAEAGVVVPEALLNEELSFRVTRFSEQLRRAGITVQQYLEGTGQTDDQVEADLRAQAERNVAAQLILEEVATREGIEATEEEVETELTGHAKATGREPDELRRQLESGGRLGALGADIIRRKALDLIVERADIKDEGSDSPESSQG